MESTERFLTHATFCSIFNININFLEFNGMIHVVKNFIKKHTECKLLKSFSIRPIIPPLFELILKNTSGAKPFYNLINSNNDIPTSQASWESKLLQKVEPTECQNIYILPFTLSKSSTLQWFQYRINHRIIGTNDLLFKMKMTNNDKYTFCKYEVENILHLFWECKISQRVIKEIFSSVFINPSLTLTKKEFILGIIKETNLMANTLILFVKMFLYSCKMHESIPTYKSAKLFISHKYKIHIEAMKEINKLNYPGNNWINIQQIFNVQ